MTVRYCVDKLVKAGRISRKTGDDAIGLYEGMQGRLGGAMPVGSAEAHAALETARIMAEAAQRRKLAVAKQLIAQQRALARVAAHPKGKSAGLMADMTTDIREAATGANIEALAETITNRMIERFQKGAEALRTGWKMGIGRDKALEVRISDEMFGVDTGDATARAAAKGFADANEFGVRRAHAAGKVFTEAEDWRVTQRWGPARLRGNEAEWTADTFRHVDSGAMIVMDRRTGAPAAPTDIPAIVTGAYEHITAGGGRNGGSAFNPEMRVFRFAEGEKGAAAWREMMGKYGAGDNLYDILTGHLREMAREIAFMDTWGPDYRATFSLLHETALREWNAGHKPAAILRPIESPMAAERTFRVLTGAASEVQSEAMAGIFGGLRSFLAAAQLGSAIIPSVPGDSMTVAFAAHYNGIPATRVLARALQLIVDSPEKRQALARLNITAYAVIDKALGAARYLDDGLAVGRGKAAKFQEIGSQAAAIVIRAQGLQAWTETLKRAFSMEMLGLVAEQSGRRFDALEPAFGRFLTRRGITAAEWEVLRRSPQLDVNGARFFDIDGVEDERLAEKLMAGIADERRYAVLEPSARVQQLTTAGLARGSFWGEMSRSVSAYKSFPMMMLVMHGSRAWLQSPAHRAAYLSALALTGTLAGAATIQAKSLLQGKDTRPMNDPAFWGASFFQGGALGIFGDLLYQGYTRGGGALTATAVGPLGSLVEQIGRLTFPTMRRAYEGEPTRVGTELARAVRWNAPGTNLWYARLAIDRLIWDQLQTMVDPDYRGSFRRLEQRMERDYGQGYWWGPGRTTPQRAPNLGNVVR
jgi:hypothetical protein